MLEGADKTGTATWREQRSTDGHGSSGEQCERAAIYWFISPGMSKGYACMEHMWRLLGAARVNEVEIPFGKLEAGEKERCGRIIQGEQAHETRLEGNMVRDIRNGDPD